MNTSGIADWLKNNLLMVWLILAMTMGAVFVFMIPPLHGNDEIVHFPRAYHVQEGKLAVEHLNGYDYGGYVPVQIKQFNDDFREQVQSPSPNSDKIMYLKSYYADQRLTDERREPLSFTSAGVYSAWSYLPAAAGVKIARVFNLPIIWYMYLARLMCLAVWLLLTYFALRLMPFGKLLLFMVALLPTSVVQASTIGMDGIVNGLSWLLIALTLSVIVERSSKKVRDKSGVTSVKLILLAVLSLYLATTKQGYALLAAFPLIIPARYYPLSPKNANYLRIAFGLMLVLVSVWYFRRTAPIADVMHFIQRPGLFVDSSAQWRYIFSHPFSVLTTVFTQPFTTVYLGVYAGLVGVLTNRLLHLPIFIVGLLYLGLVSALTIRSQDKQPKLPWKRLRIGSAVVLLGTFLLISLALYVSFTQVGHPNVEGIQGRYFLPLLPLLAVWSPALIFNKVGIRPNYGVPAVILISLSGLLSTIAIIL